MQKLAVSAEQVQGTTLILTAAQQHYLRRVLRLREGDRFLAFDGSGTVWLAALKALNQPATLSRLPDSFCLEQKTVSASPWITLAACLPKQGFDEVVRQATELGVNQIVPILSERTLLRPSLHKLQRWRRVIREAAEQSEQFTLPNLKDPISWSEWLDEEVNSVRYLCVARKNVPSLAGMCLSTRIDRIVVAIGPEGGWTNAEVEQATAAGYELVTLGRGILRAVTASIAALSILRISSELELSQLTYDHIK